MRLPLIVLTCILVAGAARICGRRDSQGIVCVNFEKAQSFLVEREAVHSGNITLVVEHLEVSPYSRELYLMNYDIVCATTAAPATATTLAATVADLTVMGKPRSWGGSKCSLELFALSLKGYVGAISIQLLAMMTYAATLATRIGHAAPGFSEVPEYLDSLLY